MKQKLLALAMTVILLLSVFSPTVLAANPPAGTTPQNPIEVTMGQTYSWSWSKTSDHLYCYNRFTVDETGMLHFQVDKLYDDEGEMCKYDIDIYDSEGEKIMAFECYYSKDLPKQVYDFYVGLKAGTYFLNLKPGFYVKSGLFTAKYSFTFTPDNCEQEPNESKAQATQLMANQWTNAYFGNDGAGYAAGTQDWFKYTMVKGSSYRISIKNYGKITSTSVIYYVYNPSGDSLYKLKDEGKSTVDEEGNTCWDYVAEESGTYYFQLDNYHHEQFAYSIKIDDLSHTHSWRQDGTGSSATCTEAGVARYVCDSCGAKKTETVPALGHDLVTGTVIKEATCTEPGVAEQTCSRCGYKNEQGTIPALGHSYGAATVIKAATCTETGLEEKTCTRCGAKSGQTSVPALGHDYKDGICTRCGAKKPVEPVNFVDVAQTAWFYEAVNYAVQNGLMNGVGNNKFAPNDPMTRAMLVTVLWRYEGEKKEGTNTFTDVPAGQWYTDAVAWAAHNGIVGGVGNGKFDPNGNITREQMAAILFRYAGGKGFDTSKRGNLSTFPDAGKVSSWATDAIAWAVAEKIIGGSDGKLLPQGNATRAQVSTILMRFIEDFTKK